MYNRHTDEWYAELCFYNQKTAVFLKFDSYPQECSRVFGSNF